MSGATTPERRDPVGATLESLAAAGRADIPADLVADAWKDALFEEFEYRVGYRMSAGMPDALLSEFERIVESGDDDAAAAWMHTHVPDHPRIVVEELERIVAEAVDWFVRTVTAHEEASR